MQKFAWLKLIILAFVITTLSACSTTSVIKSNSLIVSNTDTDAATIYFLRPEPTRTRGDADNDIKVELGDSVAVMLSAGEYVALKVKPGKTNVTIRSYTFLTSKPLPEEVHRSTEFNFEKGKIYLIHTEFVQEEFRGIYFRPRAIELANAKEFLHRLKPHGALAKANPIESL